MNLKVDISVCRVCLKSEGGVSLYSDATLMEKFQYITQLKIKQDDGMPSIICEKCAVRLKVAHEFRKQAIISDTHLRAFISKVNSQFKEVANSTASSSKEMGINEDEMQILIEAGYSHDSPSTEVTTTAHTKQEIEAISEEHHVSDDMSHHIEEDYSGFIQEDNSGGNPFVEEGDEEEMHLEEEDMSAEMTVDNTSTHEDESNMVPSQEYIVSELKDEDPLEKPKNENRSHICIKCDKDFSTKTNLMRHMLTHDGVKPFQCNICGNGFTQNGSLKQHMLIHTGERPHKCNVCGRGFTQAKSLVFHMRRHTGEKPFACDKCGLTFRQKDGLKRHVQMKHSGTPPEVHICSICNRVLQSKYSLALHMKKHLGHQGNSHKCSVCEKTFSTKASLECHQRQHTGEKPFKCETCGREFSRKSTLVTHTKIHLEDKPYKCNTCDKGFVQKHQVVAHMHNHKNQPPKTFQCGKCYKSFAIKRNLLQHLRNHNLDSMTMYKCEECSIAFNTKRGLKLHRFNEHKEAVSDLNECDICNIPFVSVNDLNQHMIAVHDTIDEKCEICMQHFTSKKLLEDHLLEHELLTISGNS